MKVSQEFIEDLRYLRRRYEWTDADVAEFKEVLKAESKENKHEMQHFLMVLAKAHRAGYEQDAANNFQRLQTWCATNGLPDPFGPGFDLAALDAMAIEQRRAA
jgi:hypothetical protein